MRLNYFRPIFDRHNEKMFFFFYCMIFLVFVAANSFEHGSSNQIVEPEPFILWCFPNIGYTLTSDDFFKSKEQIPYVDQVQAFNHVT